MSLVFDPVILPFVLSLIITIALGIHASRRQTIPAATTFALLMLTLSIWTFCYTMELASVGLDAKIFWLKMKYLGSAPAPVICFYLSLQLTKHERWLNRGVRAAILAWIGVTWAVVFSNDLSHLMWERIFLLPGLPETQSEHGPFFWVYAGVLYGVILTSVILYFRHYQSTPTFFRRQASLTALGGFIPLAGRIPEDLLGLDLVPKVDQVILFFLLSGIFFTLAIFRYSALNLLPIAHNLIFQHINAGIIVLDSSERVVELNQVARTLLGRDHAAAIGRRLKEVLLGWPPILVTPGVEQEISVTHDEQARHFSVQVSAINEANGVTAGNTIVLFDITARKEAEEQLATLARTDPLTGVINRRFFFDLAETEVARHKRYGHPLAILMLDIDHFKSVNDQYGHFAGDQVIKHVAAACQQQLRSTDIFARFGGEELICLLGEANPMNVAGTAERIRQSIQESVVQVGDQTISVTLSVGVACCDSEEHVELQTLIHHADEALYASKAGGRNRVTVWDGPC